VSDLDDLPIFRPLMGGGRRPQSRSQAGSLRNAVLASLRRGPGAFRARPRAAGRGLGPGARRVIIKARVHRMGTSGAKTAALHLRYIERDGVDKDGSKGVLYTATGAARAEAFEQPVPGEKHQFRLIVSPEDGAELELTEYVRRLMATVERDVDRKVEWAAVNHYDTEHPHAHVIIRGVDRDGREVRLARAYISNGLRVRAQELATAELGPRHALDVQRTRAKEVTQDRFTSLDREIERLARDNLVEVAPQAGITDTSVLVARLKHLEGVRLAERFSPTYWKLTDGWQQPLRDLGARGDILKQIHAAVSADPARCHIVGRGQAVPTDPAGGGHVVSGRVASKGLSDELKGDFYAVIETPTGRAYHVALDRRGAETVRAGDIVSLTTRPEGSVRAAERQDEAPVRHRLVVHKEALSLQAQVHHPGPVWLDRVKTDSLAPYGFGAELKGAVEQRHEALRRLGVQRDDPNRSGKLRELERRGVGRELAALSGEAFVPSIPDAFRGRVQLGAPGAPGDSYAVVSDGQRFVVLRATVALRALHGKTVTVTRDAKGRLLVRPEPGKDIGS
jgi:type IV secretory pathway VirD2 relaxase